MAVKGLSIPVFGRYNYNPTTGKVTYSGGMINPHAIEYTLTPESTDNNPLYGDNQIIENDTPRFNGATLSLGIDDLVQEVAEFILGVKIVQMSYGPDKTVKVTVYDDEQTPPFLGQGIIEEHQIDDVNRYKAVIMNKVQFNNPEATATTRGESIEWQTKTIEGNVSRSDETSENGVHPWKTGAWFDSEAEALAYLKYMLGVGTLGTLTVQSAAGSEAGQTQITVTPEKTGTNVYYYQVGTSLKLPEYNQDCSDMTEWNGTDEITAESGQQILIVECEGTNARAAGIQTVTANGGT